MTDPDPDTIPASLLDDIRAANSRDLDSDERIEAAIAKAAADVRAAQNTIAAALYALESAAKGHHWESSVIYDDIGDTLYCLDEGDQ